MDKYRNTVDFEVHGQLALFTDIVTKMGGEKHSYQIPTYEAIKGVLHSIYWKPTFIWIVDKIRVMNPVNTQFIGTKRLLDNGTYDLSYYTYLTDVSYQVRSHFEWNHNRPEFECDRDENKHHNIALRMIERGGRRDIFLGTRECQAYVVPCEFGSGDGAYDNSGVLSYGRMLHSHIYPDEATRPEDTGNMTVTMWDYVMKNGIITLPRPEQCQAVSRKSMPMKSFPVRG